MFEKHCWAEIDLDAIKNNFHFIKETTAKPVCAVVKADAYGHGDKAVAALLEKEGAAAFAVSNFTEALRLRKQGIRVPILILGYTDPVFAGALAHHNLTATVFSSVYAAALSAAARDAGVTVPCHLKVDTGMGRIGFGAVQDPDNAVRELSDCYAMPGICVQGIYQHFAAADSDLPSDTEYTNRQLQLFKNVVASLQNKGHHVGVVHCANSAAMLRYPGALEGMHLVRAGIVLYGLNPSEDAHFPALRPAMTVKAVIEQVKDLAPEQSVSYGRTFTNESERPMRVATVTVGYADGYPRLLSGSCRGGVMMVRGKPAPVLGRVCMDQTVIDVGGIEGVAMGDEVTVLGPGASSVGADTVDTIAHKTETINYEVVCGLSRRVPRVYLQQGVPYQIASYLEES